MQEAMAQVKNGLGRDAVILHTRRYRKGGIAGFFGKEMVEVMAAVDSSPLHSIPNINNANLSQVIKAVSGDQTNQASPTVQADSKVSIMHNELTNMKQMLEQLLVRSTSEKPTTYWHQLLLNNEIEPAVVEHILQGLPLDNSTINSNPEIIKQMIFDRFCNHFRNVDGINVQPVGCKKVAFIGPTGVGKTTTIAKLAAQFTLSQGYKAALIASDTYRIAAVEQLKTYADILNIPIEIVYVPEDLKNALIKHKDKNIILIDTAGRSPSNEEQMKELQTLLTVDSTIETHLVLSATTKYKDALEIIQKFSVCSPEKLIFTKLDETSNVGTIFNVLYQYPGVTLSYLTTGQNVPEDIELANSHKLVQRLLREEP